MGTTIDLRTFTPETIYSFRASGETVELSVNDVVNWLAPRAPVKEALGFLRTCQATGLNPWLRDIYLLPMGGKWATVVAKDGYVHHAQRSPKFGGYEAGIVIQAIDPGWKRGSGPVTGVGPMIDIEGTILPGGHRLLGGWCRAWKIGEARPYYQRVPFSEYTKPTPPWETYPCTMIRKVAVAHVFREAYEMGGTYHDSEIPALTPDLYARYVGPVGRPADGLPAPEQGTTSSVRAIEAMYHGAPDPHLPPEVLGEIHRLLGAAGHDEAWVARHVLASRDVDHLADLAIRDANELIRFLEMAVAKKDFSGNFPDLAVGTPPSPALTGAVPLDEAILGGAEAGESPAAHGGAEPVPAGEPG